MHNRSLRNHAHLFSFFSCSFVLFWCVFDCAFALLCIPALEGLFLVSHGRLLCLGDHHDVLLDHALERAVLGLFIPSALTHIAKIPPSGLYSNSTRSYFILLSIFALAYVHFHRTSRTPLRSTWAGNTPSRDSCCIWHFTDCLAQRIFFGEPHDCSLSCYRLWIRASGSSASYSTAGSNTVWCYGNCFSFSIFAYLSFTPTMILIYFHSVVTVFRWLWCAVLDSRGVRHRPAEYHSNTSRHRPL